MVFSECNTCVKCGIWFKYGIQLHRCSKEPRLQEGRHYSDENTRAIERREFAHSCGCKFRWSMCSFAAGNKAYFETHNLNYSGERKFRCNLYSYATKHKGYLNVHDLNHSTSKSSNAVCVHMQLARKEILKDTI